MEFVVNNWYIIRWFFLVNILMSSFVIYGYYYNSKLRKKLTALGSKTWHIWLIAIALLFIGFVLILGNIKSMFDDK